MLGCEMRFISELRCIRQSGAVGLLFQNDTKNGHEGNIAAGTSHDIFNFPIRVVAIIGLVAIRLVRYIRGSSKYNQESTCVSKRIGIYSISPLSTKSARRHLCFR